MALWAGFAGKSDAVEYSFGLYSLGSGAVGAGQTPPTGLYFTTALGYTNWSASKAIPFGGTTAAVKANAPVSVDNILVVLPNDVLGGHLSVSATTGFGDMSVNASVFGGITGQRATQGLGAIDSNVRASLGWDISPELSHKVSVTMFLPTGAYSPGFFPILGLNRLGADLSWGATLMEPTNKIELSATAGFTYEGYNPTTLYQSGNAVHFEEGLLKHFDNGFRLGVISYQYVQVNGDSGQGAVLGPFMTDAVAVGPSAGYTTLIDNHLVNFTLQAAHEVVAERRLRATSVLLSTTFKF
jgi:hypothetical protein